MWLCAEMPTECACTVYLCLNWIFFWFHCFFALCFIRNFCLAYFECWTVYVCFRLVCLNDICEVRCDSDVLSQVTRRTVEDWWERERERRGERENASGRREWMRHEMLWGCLWCSVRLWCVWKRVDWMWMMTVTLWQLGWEWLNEFEWIVPDLKKEACCIGHMLWVMDSNAVVHLFALLVVQSTKPPQPICI